MTFGGAVSAIEITCDYVEKTDRSTTCEFSDATEIKSEMVVLKHSDSTVTDIRALGRKSFLYLPIRVYESFPNVSVYTAIHCEIQKISKRNFRKLTNLVTLYLNQNKITTIEEDTFDDLEKLETLGLSEF